MTARQFRAALKKLRWTPASLAAELDVSYAAVRRWAGLDPVVIMPVPPEVADWLQVLVDFRERHPPPRPSSKRYVTQPLEWLPAIVRTK